MANPFSLEAAEKFIASRTSEEASRYFGLGSVQVGLGTGVIYDGIAFPTYNENQDRFEIVKGMALVLTHECDIDTSNAKLFNKDVLIAPVGRLEDLFSKLKEEKTDDEVKGYLGDFVSGRISQLFYLPPFVSRPHGAFVALNRISPTHVSRFTNIDPTIALSAYGHMKLCERLGNHLLRSKADALPRPQ